MMNAWLVIGILGAVMWIALLVAILRWTYKRSYREAFRRTLKQRGWTDEKIEQLEKERES